LVKPWEIQPSLLIVAASFMLVSGWREQEGVSKSAQPAASAPGDPKVQKQSKDAKKQIATRTYDVSDLVSVRALGRSQVPSLWGIEFNNENDDGMAALVRVILTATDQENWTASGEKNILQELNGQKLEIRTSLDNHEAIGNLLAALRRLADVAVVMESQLFEVDAAFYRKKIEPLSVSEQPVARKRFAVVIKENLAQELRQQGAPVRSHKVTIADREARRFFSWQTAFNYLAQPKGASRKPADYLGTAFHGASLEAGVQVSADRRSVELKITQRTAELLALEKKIGNDPITGDEVSLDSPKFLNLTTSETILVEDEEYFLVPLHYRPASVKRKGHVLILLVRPTVYIEDEQRQRRNTK
jgi:hypothetical protein